jgi:hypothetical protein
MTVASSNRSWGKGNQGQDRTEKGLWSSKDFKGQDFKDMHQSGKGQRKESPLL